MAWTCRVGDLETGMEETAVNRPSRRMAKVFEDKNVPIADIVGCVCAWDGCAATFSGSMPRGWINLLAYWSRHRIFCKFLRKISRVIPFCAQSMRAPLSPSSKTFVDLGRCVQLMRMRGRCRVHSSYRSGSIKCNAQRS